MIKKNPCMICGKGQHSILRSEWRGVKIEMLILNNLSKKDMDTFQLSEQIQPVFDIGIHGMVILLLQFMENDKVVSSYINLEMPTQKIYCLEEKGVSALKLYRVLFQNFIDVLQE